MVYEANFISLSVRNTIGSRDVVCLGLGHEKKGKEMYNVQNGRERKIERSTGGRLQFTLLVSPDDAQHK